jgi:hypothetical protein
MTALKTLLSRDNDEYTARRSANMLLHLLDEFIPRSCHRDAARKLFNAMMENGLELTTSAQRKEYETWKANVLHPLISMQPGPVFIGENPGSETVQGG